MAHVMAVEVGVLFMDPNILILNKPPGIISHSEGVRNPLLPETWELLQIYYPYADLVHRIDKMTSGLLLASIWHKSHNYFRFNWHGVTKKKYLAIIRNPEWRTNFVDVPLDGKTAATSFKVIERNEDGFALVLCELVRNGRKHQIRKHLEILGCPIVGDRQYGGETTNARRGQMLHAWKLSLRLPDNNYESQTKWTLFQSPIHEDFKNFSFDWEKLDKGSIGQEKSLIIPEGWMRKY